MKRLRSLRNLLRQVHTNERGSVSLETILIIGAIALPILIFLLKFGWPKIRGYFDQGIQDLDSERQKIQNNN